MSTAGRDLLDVVVAGAWNVLERYRSELAGVLSELGPDSAFAGTTLEGRVLEAIAPDVAAGGDTGVAALVSALQTALPAPGGPANVSLHGFDPGGGQPRGIALVAAVAPSQVHVVTALTGAGPTGLALEIAATGAGAFDQTLPLLNGWLLKVSGDAAGGARLQLPRGGPSEVLGAGAPVHVAWRLTRDEGAARTVIGPATGPHLSVSSVAVTVATQVDASRVPALDVAAALPRASLALPPNVFTPLLGDAPSVPIDLAFRADADRGLTFDGAGVETAFATEIAAPGVTLNAVRVGLSADGPRVMIEFKAGFHGGMSALPFVVAVDGFGLRFPVSVGAGDLGVDAASVTPLLPTAIGVDLTLPMMSGGGLLATDGRGNFAGVLDLDLIAVTVKAFGLLRLPEGGQPLSFAAIVSVTFPPPGIQLGFGFSLNAVGGIVAVNSRLDERALEAAVLDGSADQLFFPVDPARHATAVIATMARVFPPAPGHLVIGPLLQIGWGGRLLTMTVAVVIELPNPVRMVIVGRIMLALPDPAVPIVLIQGTVLGTFELSPVPGVRVLAALKSSNMAGIPLHGELFFLLRGGDDAAFVLSIGGFHPRYSRPAGVPQLQRVPLDITPPGFPALRSDAYVAVTSNSVQFGAHLTLAADIAGCGVVGWFDFDALFQWDPVFAFRVQCSAGVAVRVLGETLMGISFDLLIEGPAPWHVRGSGSIELLLFSVSLDIDFTWDDQPRQLRPAPDLYDVFATALGDRSAWVGVPPAGDHAHVTLSQHATSLLRAGRAVHPLGSVVVRQRAVPLRIPIDRYLNLQIERQTWTIEQAAIGSGDTIAFRDDTQDEFVTSHFLTLSEDEQLARPAFEFFASGVTLTPPGVVSAPLRMVDTDFETKFIPEQPRPSSFGSVFVDLASEALLAIDDLHRNDATWIPRETRAVLVSPSQPMAAVTTVDMRVQSVVRATDGFTATLEAARQQFGQVGPAAAVQVVEAWELREWEGHR